MGYVSKKAGLVACVLLAGWAFVSPLLTRSRESEAGAQASKQGVRGADENPDPLMPPSWAGQWSITLTYRDTATNNTGAIDEITEVLCPNEPFGLILFGSLGNLETSCSGTASDTHLEVSCSSQFNNDTCGISGTLHVAVDREGESLSGSGQWSTTVTGDCDSLVSGGEMIEVSGVRLNADQGACEQPFSLAQKFVTHPSAIIVANIPFDLAEFAQFQRCFSGDDGGVHAGCESFDMERDGDIDLNDYRRLWFPIP